MVPTKGLPPRTSRSMVSALLLNLIGRADSEKRAACWFHRELLRQTHSACTHNARKLPRSDHASQPPEYLFDPFNANDQALRRRERAASVAYCWPNARILNPFNPGLIHRIRNQRVDPERGGQQQAVSEPEKLRRYHHFISPSPSFKRFKLIGVDKVVSPRRFLVMLLSGFAGFALLLASLGIYALISYSVNQRTKEIGIRMALGASASLVQRDVLAKTLRLALAGVALGTIGSFALSKWIGSLLFGTTPTDPATFSGVILLLCTVALVAAYIPARRASRIDPMRLLRTE